MEHLTDPDATGPGARPPGPGRPVLGLVRLAEGGSYVENPGVFDAMFNYEALIIEANQALVARGEEPLYAIYPANGLSVADSPLGYISKGDPAKEDAFLALQEFLGSTEAQDLLTGLGRRAGLIGLGAERCRPHGLEPGLGHRPRPRHRAHPHARVCGDRRGPAALPDRAPQALADGLGAGRVRLDGGRSRSRISSRPWPCLLDPEAAAVNLLQPSARDVTIILPFNHGTSRPCRSKAPIPADACCRRWPTFNGLQADGGTDVYYVRSTRPSRRCAPTRPRHAFRLPAGHRRYDGRRLG
jgi:Ca-activated chloride channel family protein